MTQIFYGRGRTPQDKSPIWLLMVIQKDNKTLVVLRIKNSNTFTTLYAVFNKVPKWTKQTVL